MLAIKALAGPLFGPIDLAVDSGRCVAIRGASGSGKSVFLRAVVDLDPNRGEVTLDGVARGIMPAPAWRRRVMLVPAESGWWGDRVGEHFAANAAGNAADNATLRELLTALGFAAGVLEREVAELSTGERHRLALARALALTPEALLLDEPTAALDPDSGERVERLIRREMARGARVLLVTHDAAQAARLAERVCLMERGRLREAGAGE